MGKVLITGAAGFIGSQLAYRLWMEREDVVLLDDFSYGHEDNLMFDRHDFRPDINRIDIRDVSAMDSLFQREEFDYVYHIAGITSLPDCQNDAVGAVDVNVRGTTVVLDMARKHGVRKIFFASTSAIYENCKDFPSMEENVMPPSLIYPSTKYASEQICRAFSAAYGIPVVCFRFANVYGPHIDCLRTQPPVMGYIIREFYKGKSPVLHATGEQERDFIFVDDIIDLCLAARSADQFDIVNASTETTASINQVAGMIAKKMHREEIPVRYEDVCHYWSGYPELYGGPYPISEEMLEHEVLKYTCLSNRHAREKYGWNPKTALEDGIERTVEYAVRMLKIAGVK